MGITLFAAHLITAKVAYMQVVDYNFLSTLLSLIGQYMPDFKKQRAAANGKH